MGIQNFPRSSLNTLSNGKSIAATIGISMFDFYRFLVIFLKRETMVS